MKGVQRAKIWLIEDPSVLPPTAINSSDSQDYCAILDGKQFSDEGINDTPHTPTLGALRSGGPLELRSWEAIGLLSQYASVGCMMGFFEVLAYPVFQNYLHMEGYQIASYTALIHVGWAIKILMAVIGDCFPICGYHRQPYMILGWTISAGGCLAIALREFPSPYYTSEELYEMPRSNYTASDLDKLTLDAPLTGGYFILMSLVVCLGYVMATVAADGMVVQYAQREPTSIRGRIQTAIYLTRDAFSVLPMFLVGFCMNDFKYGGEFSWSVAPNIIFGIITVPCVLAAIFALFFVVESPKPSVRFGRYMALFWDFLQQRIVWQLCCFNLFYSIFFSYTSTLKSPMVFLCIYLEPLTSTMFLIVAQLLRLVAMLGVGRYALDWNWRWTILACTISLVILDVSINLAATWDVIRDQYFYSALIAIEAVPTAIIFLFTNYLAVEVADVGNESLAHAVTTSCSNLGIPLSIVLAKTFDSFLNANLDSIEDDSIDTRWELTYSFLASGVVKLLSLCFMLMLPKQKAYVHVLKRIGNKSQPMAIFLSVFFIIGFLVALSTSVLSILPSTYCLPLAGGKGC